MGCKKIISQWGRGIENTYYTFPISFTEMTYSGVASHNIANVSNGNVYSVVIMVSHIDNKNTIYLKSNYTNDAACRFIVIGY